MPRHIAGAVERILDQHADKARRPASHGYARRLELEADRLDGEAERLQKLADSAEGMAGLEFDGGLWPTVADEHRQLANRLALRAGRLRHRAATLRLAGVLR